MHGFRGYFAAVVDEEGPVHSSPLAYRDPALAERDARDWAATDELPLRLGGAGPHHGPNEASRSRRCYAGIGSRDTPPSMLDLMRTLAARLAIDGWTLRSGAAPGADSAFEQGALDVGGRMEIYLPWPGFESRPRNDDRYRVVSDPAVRADAERIAAEHHRAWDRLPNSVRSLHTRNVHQVLGATLKNPCRFVVCWARLPVQDAVGRGINVAGGTGEAVRIAASHGIEVINLVLPEHLARCQRWLAGDAASSPEALL